MQVFGQKQTIHERSELCIKGQSIGLPNTIRKKWYAVVGRHNVIDDCIPIEQHQFPTFAELNFAFQA
ncbi:hypothetical protein SDC9_105516 [bioreactor metagenome]|uniref:Uncharacterized protein n=1 Tax=bioreactor metagenome TaxID=1076179 RepID=A0A645B6B4_9ZZZZ